MRCYRLKKKIISYIFLLYENHNTRTSVNFKGLIKGFYTNVENKQLCSNCFKESKKNKIYT